MSFSEDLTGQVINCIFENNTSGSHGGAIAVIGGFIKILGCRFVNNQALEGGAVAIQGAYAHVEGCTFQGNSAALGGGLLLKTIYAGAVMECTFFGNAADQGGAMVVEDIYDQPFNIYASIMAGSTVGEGLYWDGDNDLVLTSCDIFGNAGGDWVGDIAGQQQQKFNFQLDPLFCDPAAGDFSLAANSPCLAENSLGGVQVGAWGLGCGFSATSDLPGKELVVRCFPNPFNPRVNVSFTLQQTQSVEVEIYDLNGRRVARLNQGALAVGLQKVTWNGLTTDGAPAPSGSYLVRVSTAEGTASRKVLLLK